MPDALTEENDDLRRALELSQGRVERLRAELGATRTVLAEAIIAMGGSFEYRPRLADGEWAMSGPEPMPTGVVYRAAWQPRSGNRKPPKHPADA